MGIRGRQSSSSLSVISGKGIESVRRPKPSSDLTDEQAAEWIAIVNRLPADWFPRETHGVLAQFCRHIVAARRVAQLIDAAEAADEFGVGGYDALLKMQEREGRALSSLATRMRLTQQATYDAGKKKPGPTKKPWED